MSAVVLENPDLPLAARVLPDFGVAAQAEELGPVCLNGKCRHSDDYHRLIYGGILGTRYRCEVCDSEGGRCR